MSDSGQFTPSLGVRLGFGAAYLLVLMPCLFLAATRLQWIYKDRKDKVRTALLVAVISLLILYFIFDIALASVLGSYNGATVENVRSIYSILILSILFTFLADFVLAFLLLRGLLSLLRNQDENVEGVVKASKTIGAVVVALLSALNLVRLVFYCDSYGTLLTLINVDSESQIRPIEVKATQREIWAVKVEVAYAWIYLVYNLAILFAAAVVGIRYRQRDQLTIPLFAATIFTVGARFLMFMIFDFLQISSTSNLNLNSALADPDAKTSDASTDANIVIGVLSGLFTVLYCVGLVLLGIRKPQARDPASPYVGGGVGNANRMTMASMQQQTAYQHVDYKQVPTQEQHQQHAAPQELPGVGQEPAQLPAERTDLLQELGGDEPVREQATEGKKKHKLSGLFSGSKDKDKRATEGAEV